MPTAFVNIGSNLGCREKNIEKALDLIGDLFGFYCLSEPVETESWGYKSANKFLNIGVAFNTALSSVELLASLKFIEKEISSKSHRDSEGNYCDREIDIDIMAIDSIVYDSDLLHVPHKHLKERIFFLLPLKDLSPEWRFPETNESIDELLSKIPC